MNRYQIYLEPKIVNTLDDVSDITQLNRSKIIRDVLARVVAEYEKLLLALRSVTFKNHPLLKMSGIIKEVKLPVSENVDEIYLRD